MADISLSRPQAGQVQNVPSEDGARFVFAFPAADATIKRTGDNLEINFDDGAIINIDNFYGKYNSENMPSFNVDGQEVGGKEFFEAMNEPDLMPAAGPAAAAQAERGARNNEWGNSDLAGGLEHLTRLDYNSDRNFEWDDPNWITSPDADGFYANALAGLEGVPGQDAPGSNNSLVPPTADRPIYTPEQPVHTPENPIHTPEQPPYAPPQDATPDTPATPSQPTPSTPDNPGGYDPDPVPPANTTPGVEVPPNKPWEDSGRPDNPANPDNPGNPAKPGAPGDHDTPGNPDNPDKPADPNDPDNPQGPNFIHAGNSTIVVDEGAIEKIGSQGHAYHGAGGHGSVILDVHYEGSGRAVFSLADRLGNTVEFNQMKAEPVSGKEVAPDGNADLEVNGVKITVTGATYNSGSGKWTVNYDYKLVSAQEHGAPGTEQDNVLAFGTDNAILVTVNDFSHDPAEGYITVEIHDDVPVLGVTPEAATQKQIEDFVPNESQEYLVASSSLGGEFTIKYGADGESGQSADSGDYRLQIGIDGGEAQPLLFTGAGSAEFVIDGKGTLTITDKGDNQYAYSFVPVAGNAEISVEVPFEVMAVDGDLDMTVGNARVDINFRPEIRPVEPGQPTVPEGPVDPEDKDPDPGEPEDPRDQDQPTGPEDPDDPEQPDDPNLPEGKYLDVIASRVTVDEADWAADQKNRTDVEQGLGHSGHGFNGQSALTFVLHGHEEGSLFIGANGEIQIDVSYRDGEPQYNFAKTGKVETGRGVSIELVEDPGLPVISQNEDGSFTVNFKYELGAAQDHDQQSGHDLAFADYVPVTVRDSIGNDEAHASIKITVHDDRPDVDVVEDGMNNSVTTNFGADTWGEAEQTPLLEVFCKTEAGQPARITWTKADGTTDFNLHQLGNAETWSAMVSDGHGMEHTIEVKILHDVDTGQPRYVFSTPDTNLTEEMRQVLTVKITDSDKDEDTVEVVVTAPRIRPEQPGDPDEPKSPDPQDENGKPLLVADRIVRDEGEQTEKLNENDVLDTGHVVHGGPAGSFVIGLNGEDGQIRIGVTDGDNAGGSTTGGYTIDIL